MFLNLSESQEFSRCLQIKWIMSRANQSRAGSLWEANSRFTGCGEKYRRLLTAISLLADFLVTAPDQRTVPRDANSRQSADDLIGSYIEFGSSSELWYD
jgi:hypothetical protein